MDGPKISENSTGDPQIDESRISVKKEELPMFEGEDPVAWITRTKIYSGIQNTSKDVKLKFARLSMEGSTIHLFKSLMETKDELSWEKLKKALIARYGG